MQGTLLVCKPPSRHPSKPLQSSASVLRLPYTKRLDGRVTDAILRSTMMHRRRSKSPTRVLEASLSSLESSLSSLNNNNNSKSSSSSSFPPVQHDAATPFKSPCDPVVVGTRPNGFVGKKWLAVGLLMLVSLVWVSPKNWHGEHNGNEALQSADPDMQRSLKNEIVSNLEGRFPLYGTSEFTEQCSWTEAKPPAVQKDAPECTFLIRPQEGEGEGIALWVSQVTTGYILARQAGCRLLIDYGPGVDIRKVIIDSAPGSDWAIAPPDFLCDQSKNCYKITERQETAFTFKEEIPGHTTPLAPVPFYRFAGWGGIDESTFISLTEALVGFRVATGMACALGKLFQLAPTADAFVPALFTKILPKLRHPHSLVITLYVRTSQTELGTNATEHENIHKYEKIAEPFTKHAIALESRYLSGALRHEREISSVVWMVISDSQYVTHWVEETMGGKDANADMPDTWRSTRPINREILYTRSRGAHTRSRGNPSTIDFGQAFIDWYLIGESDAAVINKQYTFGYTGSMRTAVPVHDLDGNLVQLVRSGGSTSNELSKRLKANPSLTVSVIPGSKTKISSGAAAAISS